MSSALTNQISKTNVQRSPTLMHTRMHTLACEAVQRRLV
jgi:hypothetical protein